MTVCHHCADDATCSPHASAPRPSRGTIWILLEAGGWVSQSVSQSRG
jgi:hypothetical protein